MLAGALPLCLANKSSLRSVRLQCSDLLLLLNYHGQKRILRRVMLKVHGQVGGDPGPAPAIFLATPPRFAGADARGTANLALNLKRHMPDESELLDSPPSLAR